MRGTNIRGAGRGARAVRRALTALVALTLAAAGTGLAATAAHADTDDETLRFSVTTADAEGPDDRRVVNLELDPGESAEDRIAVSNHGRVAVTFSMVANDGLFTPMGNFDIRASNAEPQDSGAWFTVDPEVTVEPGETVVVPFTVTAPERATPGDHPAGIAATVLRAADGANVGLESRVGVRVNIRVTGEVTPVLEIADPVVTYSPSWNPFAAGDVTVGYDLVNDGNVRLGADQSVTASGPFGAASRTVDVDPEGASETLPGGSRTVTTQVTGVWPLGRVTTEITVTPTQVGDIAIDATLRPVTVEVTTWAIPWPQLLVLAGLVVVVLAIRADRRRRRRQLEALLERARAEGRQAAVGAEGDPDGAAPASVGAARD